MFPPSSGLLGESVDSFVAFQSTMGRDLVDSDIESDASSDIDKNYPQLNKDLGSGFLILRIAA